MSHHRTVRWLPAVVAPLVVAGAVAVPLTAAAAPDVPQRTAQQVLRLALASDVPGFSGTVEQTSDLGLPSLPTTGGSGSEAAGAASALELLTGDHTARVWVRGDDQRRIAVLDTTAERDAVVDGDQAWLWDSKKNTAVHLIGTGSAPEGTTRSPDEVAKELLAHLDPSTAVTVDSAERVAGRDAYTLVLTPRSAGTTVGSVRLAVDAATGLPLSVQVTAKGASSPAFRTAFTSLSTDVPAAGVFDFTPPSDAEVTTKRIDASDLRGHRSGAAPQADVTGSGWSSIVELPASSVPDGVAADGTFQQLSTAVAGGRTIGSALVNVLLTDDGRVLAGAVPLSALQAAATR